MMMAHDSGPGSNDLTEETIEAVRSALVQYAGNTTPVESLGSALRIMAAEARNNSMQPERLLIVLKDIWYSLPAVQNMSEPRDQVRLLQSVVTMCIKEYYAD